MLIKLLIYAENSSRKLFRNEKNKDGLIMIYLASDKG